jgi:ribosomal-protein-alanine acetyltransferase
MQPASPTYEIRVARAEHDEAVRELARVAGLRVNAEAERTRAQAGLHVAVTEAGQVLGFVLGWVAADELELMDICVADTFRRRGIGRKLVEHQLSWAGARGAHVAHLEVRASNLGALVLYQTMGFHEVGRRHAYYSDGEDAMLLRREM